MGYTIIIGELPLDDPMAAPGIIFREKAPASNEDTTPHSNERRPSYSGWEDFTKATGLYEMFFNKKNGLFRNHPGMERITKKHKLLVDKAAREYKEKGKNDLNYERLVWLKFWVDWVLKYCHCPVIYNS